MNEIYAALIAAAVAIIGAIATYIVNNLKAKDIRDRVETLEEFINSDDTEYYIECPNCKSKIILSKVKILVNKQDNDK